MFFLLSFALMGEFLEKKKDISEICEKGKNTKWGKMKGTV